MYTSFFCTSVNRWLLCLYIVLMYFFVGLAVGAVDENDFIRAYNDTPTVQVS